MEKSGIGTVGFVLVGGTSQRGDVTAITIAVDRTTIGKDSVNLFTDACLRLDATRIFRMRRLPRSSKDNATKTLEPV